MATQLDENDAPLKPAPRPKPSFKRFFPVVNHYVRFDTQDLDPTVCDLRQKGEFPESTGPTHAINYLCWRRSGLHFNMIGVALITAIQLAQAVNVFGPVQDQDGLIKKWFSPECPTYEERAAAAIDRCNAHCVNRSAVGFEALQHVVDERSASLANSSVEAAEAWAAELANRTLANALLDLDLDVALIIGSDRGRRLQCHALEALAGCFCGGGGGGGGIDTLSAWGMPEDLPKFALYFAPVGLVFGIAAGAWAHSREQTKKKTKKQLESEFEEKRRRSGARSAGFDDDDDDFD